MHSILIISSGAIMQCTPFKNGDLVQLLSGGAVMTVNRDDWATDVGVVWTDKNDTPHEKYYDFNLLKHYVPKEEI